MLVPVLLFIVGLLFLIKGGDFDSGKMLTLSAFTPLSLRN